MAITKKISYQAWEFNAYAKIERPTPINESGSGEEKHCELLVDVAIYYDSTKTHLINTIRKIRLPAFPYPKGVLDIKNAYIYLKRKSEDFGHGLWETWNDC